VITDAAGNIKAESDYYPWGGELEFVNNDTNDYKFTGKERDTEKRGLIILARAITPMGWDGGFQQIGRRRLFRCRMRILAIRSR
jgi:uncharacterized protein RhaS with RHS repeats